MAMTLVSTVTVGSGGAASIEFTNIPQTGKDLLVLVSARRDDSGALLALRANGLSTGIYDYRNLVGTGSAASSTTATGDTGMDFIVARSTATASTFGNTQIYISNYTSSANKSVSIDGVNENNATAADMRLTAGLIGTTNAITSITLTSATSVQHSTASLYIIS